MGSTRPSIVQFGTCVLDPVPCFHKIITDKIPLIMKVCWNVCPFHTNIICVVACFNGCLLLSLERYKSKVQSIHISIF